MGNPKGFIQIERKAAGYRPLNERIDDFGEVEQTLNEQDRKDQASRCMDCGIPFCQWGCPVMNNMPEWQDAIYRGNWKEAIDLLHVTNNFPEFTGRICPAPCEHACTLNIHQQPVTIRENEASAAEKGFELGYIVPNPPKNRTGKKVAVVGSGPSGLACADLLNKWGHTVTVFEKDDVPGGLLRYGIPDFKLNKKTKKLARLSALSYKAKENNIVVLEDFTFETPKTKNFLELLKNFSLENQKTLVVVPENDLNVYLSSRNLKKVKILRASDLNTYEILDAHRMLIMESSVKDIEKVQAN